MKFKDIDKEPNIIDKLLDENQELKKQLEETKEMHKTMARYALDNEAKIDKYNNQQKEFIQYLDNKRDKYAENLEYWSSELTSIILSKYKEIIGDKE